MPNEITRYRRPAAAAAVLSTAIGLYNRNPAAFRQAASDLGTIAGRTLSKVRRKMESPLDIVEKSAPAAIGHQMTKGEPTIRQSSKAHVPKTVTVSNREVISLSIPGSSSWTSQLEFDLNPGLSSTFPWLSNVAEQYQEYKFTKLIVYYVPIVPTSTQGDVIITPFYDALQPYPVSETQASDTVNAVIGSVWMEHKCKLSNSLMHPSGVKKYIRSFRMSGDAKNYDVGRLQISTVNETGTSPIGKLYLDYTVQLFGPRLAPLVTFPSTTSIWSLYANQSFTGSTVQYNTGTFNPLTTNADPLGIVFTSSGQFSLPDGNYRVEYSCVISDTNSESNTIIPFIYDVLQTRYYYGPPVNRPSGTYQTGGYAIGQVWSVNNTASVPASTTPSFQVGVSFSGTSGAFVANANSLTAEGCYVIITLL